MKNREKIVDLNSLGENIHILAIIVQPYPTHPINLSHISMQNQGKRKGGGIVVVRQCISYFHMKLF